MQIRTSWEISSPVHSCTCFYNECRKMHRGFVRVTQIRVIHAPASSSSSASRTATEEEKSRKNIASTTVKTISRERPEQSEHEVLEQVNNTIGKRTIVTGIINLGVQNDMQIRPDFKVRANQIVASKQEMVQRSLRPDQEEWCPQDIRHSVCE